MSIAKLTDEKNNVIEALVIEPTSESLMVSLKSGLLEFSGRSIPENPLRLFGPIIEWVENYIKNPAPSTTIDLKFEYINTSSSKFILTILEILDKAYDENKKNMSISWSYEIGDDDMYELGKFIESMIKIPMSYIEVEETAEY
jgi:hypothetical protein